MENAAMTPVRIATVMKADTNDTVHSLSSIKTLLNIFSCVSELAYSRFVSIFLPQPVRLLLLELHRRFKFTMVNYLFTLQNTGNLSPDRYVLAKCSVPVLSFAPVNISGKCPGTEWPVPGGIGDPVSYSRSGPDTTLKERCQVLQPV